MDSTALAQAFPFEAGKVWQVGTLRILIREHFPALFRSMCRKANVHNMGVDAAKGGHALLRGTAGTGKTYFMLVMFIQFLKMMRAASTVRKDSEHQVFTGAVTSILLQWDLVNRGQDILFDASPSADPLYTRVHRVHLYDAGTNLAVLPDAQGDGFYLATASADPRSYRAWDTKAFVAKQYSVLWSPSELLHLAEWEGISKDELGDRFEVVGGVPRMILSHPAATLQRLVRERLAGVTIDQVRAIIRYPTRSHAVMDMLRAVGDNLSFSLFALDVEAKDDFDNVKVKFLTKFVSTEFFKQASERTVTQVLAELRAAITGGSGLAGGTFEDWSVYELSKYGHSGQMLVLSESAASTVAQLDMEPCDTIRYFMDADHLEVLVGRHGASAMYLPATANDPLVDAWRVCTITAGGTPELVVAGCQMTVASTSHPTTDELEAKQQFEAIHRALVARREPITVSRSPWVIWVLPALKYTRFPFQHAKGGGPPGSDWPFQQGKIGMLLTEEGRTPESMEAYRSMLADTATFELASPELDAGAVLRLFNIGQRTAPMFVDAVRRCSARLAMGSSSGAAYEAEAASAGEDAAAAIQKASAANPCDAFLELLKEEGRGYAITLQHPRNWGRWVYQGHAATCIENEVKDMFAGRSLERPRTSNDNEARITLKGCGRPLKRPRTGEPKPSMAPR